MIWLTLMRSKKNTYGYALPISEAPFNHENVAAAVESIATSFEVVDLPEGEIREGQSRAHMLVATNVAQAGAVLGVQVSDWRDIDLKSARGIARLNGEVAGEGVGSDDMGHAMEPLIWLANVLAQRSDELLKRRSHRDGKPHHTDKPCGWRLCVI